MNGNNIVKLVWNEKLKKELDNNNSLLEFFNQGFERRGLNMQKYIEEGEGKKKKKKVQAEIEAYACESGEYFFIFLLNRMCAMLYDSLNYRTRMHNKTCTMHGNKHVFIFILFSLNTPSNLCICTTSFRVPFLCPCAHWFWVLLTLWSIIFFVLHLYS